MTGQAVTQVEHLMQSLWGSTPLPLCPAMVKPMGQTLSQLLHCLQCAAICSWYLSPPTAAAVVPTGQKLHQLLER